MIFRMGLSPSPETEPGYEAKNKENVNLVLVK